MTDTKYAGIRSDEIQWTSFADDVDCTPEDRPHILCLNERELLDYVLHKQAECHILRETLRIGVERLAELTATTKRQTRTIERLHEQLRDRKAE
jgi:hypothetical protein